MPIHEQVIEAFSHSIYAKIKLYRSNVLDDKGSRRLLESISFDIRKFSDLLIPRYSKAAQEKASSFGVVLSDISWHDQTKFDKGRQIFHYEHFIPISEIRALCIKSNSEEEIAEILRKKPSVIWILKDEDKRLTELGYRSNREDPVKAYWEAGIEIV